MPKLLTPVQYESALDGLNEVRPLQLADEVKIALDIPVFNTNPVDKDKPVVGKFARCNQQGALLQSNSINSIKNYVDTENWITPGNFYATVYFERLVKKILIYYFIKGSAGEVLRWITPVGYTIKQIAFNVHLNYSFRVTTMKLYRTMPVGIAIIYIRGFY